MIDDAQLARRLLDLDLVERNRLKEGRQLQLTHGTTLYDALIRHRIVEERAVVKLVAGILNIPCVHLSEQRIDPKIVKLLPPALARQKRALPLELKREKGGEQLLLAMEDPLDIMAMDEISSHISINIQPVLVGPLDMNDGLARAYDGKAPAGGAGGGLGDEFSLGLDDGVNFGALADENNGMLNEDSWGSFFDDAHSQEVPVDESSTISKDMRDRPSTIHLDDWDIDEVMEDDPISLLDEPSMAQKSGPVDDLDDWDIDASIVEGKPAPQSRPRLSRSGKQGGNNNSKDYGAIGHFYVHSPPADSSNEIPLAEEDKNPSPPPPKSSPPAIPAKPAEEPKSEPSAVVEKKKPLTFESLLDDADGAPSQGTFVASPSQSFTNPADELDLDELSAAAASQSDRVDTIEEDGIAFVLAEVAPGTAPEASDDLDLAEEEEQDESYTAVGNVGQFVSIPGVIKKSNDAAPEKNEEEEGDIFDLAISEAMASSTGGSAEILLEEAVVAAAPSPDPAPESEPEIVLEALVEEPAQEDEAPAEEDEEILLEEFEPLAEEDADVPDEADASNEDNTPAEDEASSSEAPAEEPDAPNQLGRLKLKRIAVPRNAGVGVIIEKQSHRKKQQTQEQTKVEAKPEPKAAEPVAKATTSEPKSGALEEKSVGTILTEDALIKGFEDALSDFEANPETREVSPEEMLDLSNRQIGREETVAAEDVSVPVSGTAEVEPDPEEERLAKSAKLRKLFKKDKLEPDEEPGSIRETAANEAITEEFLQKMRKETAGVTSKQRYERTKTQRTMEGVATIPEGITDSQLVRAAVMLLVAEGLLEFEDLINLARSLPKT